MGSNTVMVEYRRGRGNKVRSGEVHRYNLERGSRRQRTRLELALKHEGVGSKED